MKINKDFIHTVILLIAVVSGTVAAINYFATKESVAALSLKYQQTVTQQRIAWLEEQIINIQNQYGNPPGANCPQWIKDNWARHVKELQQKYKILEEIDRRLLGK